MIPDTRSYAPVHPCERRATDSDRELALATIGNAMRIGQLTFEEHTERLDAVLRSRTVGDLVLLTRDLARYVPAGAAPNAAPRRDNSKSALPTVSLVTSFAGLLMFPLFFLGIVGVTLGLVACGEIRTGGARFEEKPRALGAIGVGLLAIAAGIVFYALR
jgi:hypothetical protein